MDAKTALQKSYDDLSPLSQGWRIEFNEHDFTARLLGDSLKNFQDRRILDIGCGLGIFVHTLSLLGANAEGVDRDVLDEWGLKGIKEMWARNQMQITNGDFFTLPYADNSFDAIITENVFEHLLFTQREFLEKIYKILKPCGYLVLATPNLTTALKRARMLFGRSPYWDLNDFFLKKQPYGHLREFTAGELRQMVGLMGFTNITAKTHNTYFRLKWLKNLKKYPAIFCRLVSAIFPGMRDIVYIVAQKPEKT